MTVKKKQSYIVVLDWMVEKYHLKGNELLAYALIYGFSQDEESEYKGSYSYIALLLTLLTRRKMRPVAKCHPWQSATDTRRKMRPRPVAKCHPVIL